MKKSTKKQPEFEKVEQCEYFNIVRHESGEHFIAIGDCAVLKCATQEEAEEKINTQDWELLLNVMVAITKKVYNQEKEKELKQ